MAQHDFAGMALSDDVLAALGRVLQEQCQRCYLLGCEDGFAVGYAQASVKDGSPSAPYKAGSLLSFQMYAAERAAEVTTEMAYSK